MLKIKRKKDRSYSEFVIFLINCQSLAKMEAEISLFN